MELEDFDNCGKEIDLSADPTTPPPDPNKPYMWIGYAEHGLPMSEVERRAIDLVVLSERQLGREPEIMSHNNPGYDLRSITPGGHLVHLEVKGRVRGAEDFFVTNREIRVGQNADNYRLALVQVDLEDPSRDEVVYLLDPFADERVSTLVNGLQFRWKAMWDRGQPPF